MSARPRRSRIAAAVTVLVSLTVGAPALAQPPEVSARGAILWDPADDRALHAKDARRPLRPASTTKIMTVLLALERSDPDAIVTVSASAVRGAAGPGAATLDLEVGQQLPLGDLLAALILRSGNDAAVAVAEHVAGSEAAFVDLMNARAEELGLNETQFLDATGLTDDPEHHSSARDLARLGEIAMQDRRFARWAATRTMFVPGIGDLESRNELLSSFTGADGVKTGYTRLAGMCLVASATRGGRQLFAVVLDSDNSFEDAAALLRHGFSDYRRAQPLAEGAVATTYRWAGAAVPLVASDTLGKTLPKPERARYRLRLEPRVQRPVARGAKLATAELIVDGDVVERVDLRARAAVGAPRPHRSAAAGVGSALQEALRTFARASPVARGT